MISVERAFNPIQGKNTEEIRKFARNRILGADITSFGSGHSSEPSEDVVIQLLRNNELAPEKRKAVIRGCVDVYQQAMDWLNDPDWIDNIDRWKEIVVNLCRVVDIAEPKELKKYAKPFLVRLLEEEACPGEILRAAVRAYMVYVDAKETRFWEEEVLRNKETAAYGFNALLEIDVEHPRIEEHLLELWRLQIEKNWPVNTAFLLRRAARLRNERPLIYRVLLRLKNKNHSLWEEIEQELSQYSWSQQYLKELSKFEQTKHQPYSNKEQKKGIIGETRSEPKAWIEDKGIGINNLYRLGLTLEIHPADAFYYRASLINYLKSVEHDELDEFHEIQENSQKDVNYA